MNQISKLIQTEWENIWDFVFGRDTEPEPTVVAATDAEAATEEAPASQEPSTDNDTRPNLLRPGRI
jgi:hypothetical protein